jgi:DNA polymerase III epsilon subunit-like protein
LPHNPPFLVFDTETTGLPKERTRPAEDVDNWPRVVQLGWGLFADDGSEIEVHAPIIRPTGFTIPADSVRVHRITTEIACKKGINLQEALDRFAASVRVAGAVVAHNIAFDLPVVRAEIIRLGFDDPLRDAKKLCTQVGSTDYCRIPRARGFKFPTLAELHFCLFRERYAETHEAAADLRACARCFFELRRLRVLDA